MNVKRIEKTDLVELFEIHKKFYNFAFPDLTNPIYAIQRVVRDDAGKVVLAGIVKITSEVILIANKDLSDYERMKAIKLANEQLYTDAVNFGLEDFHIFAENNDDFINILRKLGFQDCTGFPMVRMRE